MKKETRNAFIGGLLVTAASGLLNPVVNKITNAITEKTTFSVDITDTEWNLTEGLKQYFKNIPDKLFVEFSSEYATGVSISYQKNLGTYSRSATNCNDTIFYKGYPITFRCSVPEKTPDGNAVNRMTLTTLNIDSAKENLREFIKDLAAVHVAHTVKKRKKENIIWVAGLHGPGCTQMYDDNLKRRTFENTFIPKKDEMEIKNAIDSFISKRDWYIKNNIPYHFGILLYSDPGTGKSSVAQAIADYADAQLISFPGDHINELPKHMYGRISKDTISADSYRVILIEDIDCGFAEKSIEEEYDEKTGEFKTVDRKIGLGSILNSLDGLMAPSNAIYVFTTNHIDKLDPALIRPGRCDLKIHIPGITVETFNRFVKHHYGVEDALPMYCADKIREDVTFAELQTEVMKGATVEDLKKKIMK